MVEWTHYGWVASVNRGMSEGEGEEESYRYKDSENVKIYDEGRMVGRNEGGYELNYGLLHDFQPRRL